MDTNHHDPASWMASRDVEQSDDRVGVGAVPEEAPPARPARFAWLSGPAPRLLAFAAFWLLFIHVLAFATAGFARVQGPGPMNWSVRVRQIETPLSRWDSRWFFTIATRGYNSAPRGQEGPVRFYPLYPALMAGTGRVTGLSPMWAGTLASALALLGCTLLLGRMGQETRARRRRTRGGPARARIHLARSPLRHGCRVAFRLARAGAAVVDTCSSCWSVAADDRLAGIVLAGYTAR